MSKKKPHTRHHFIPQCYLLNFANSKKQVYALDKITSKEYLSNISDVCYKNDLYTLPDTIAIDADSKRIETHYFASIEEPQLAALIKQIKDLCNAWLNGAKIIISNDLKFSFARQVLIMFFRSPRYQERYKTDFIDSISDITACADFSPILNHAEDTYLNEPFIKFHSNILSNNYWEFIYSKEAEFYTSDNPVSISIINKNNNVRNVHSEGFMGYGDCLSFPITKNICLAIWDKEYFIEKHSNNGSFRNAETSDKCRHNYLSYAYAERHVFSYNKDFQVVKILCKLMNNGDNIFSNNTVK